jgi:Transposase, Mutator family
MTDDMIALRELLEKGSDATLLREMIGFAAQRLMELETEALCGAGHGERSENRTNLRNGYRDRDWQTRAGTVEVRIPKLRKSLPLREGGGQLLSRLPGTTSYGGEGADRGDPGVLCPGHLDPLGGRAGQGDGDGGDQQEPGVAALCRDR